MTFSKLTLATVAIAATLSSGAAFARDGEKSDVLSALQTSRNIPAATAVSARPALIEGRQAAVVATPAKAGGVDAYLVDRNEQSHR